MASPDKDDTSSKTATPRLRFPEFRKAEGWTSKPMSTLYSFMRNNALSRDKLNYVGGTVKNIHYGDIHTKFSALFDITKERVPFINDTEGVPDDGSEDYCVEGDLIFADASEDTNDVGKSMELVRLSGERLLSGQHTILARRNDDMLVVGFGGHLFRSGNIRSQIQKEAQGTKVYAISASRLGNIDVAYPAGKAEQQKIADCLTSLDEVIAAQGRKVAALADHKRGLMPQLFPREGETLPRLRFPEFQGDGEWEPKRIDDRGDVLAGKALAVTAPGPLRPYLRTKNVLDGTIDLSDVLAMPMTDAEFGRFEILDGDVLLNEGQSLELVGRTSLYRGQFRQRCAMQNQLLRFRAFPSTCAEFAAQAFQQCQKDGTFASVATKTTSIAHLGSSRLRALVLTWPSSLAEQQRIAACLSALDTQISAESNRLAALKTHKRALMQQLFPTAAVSEQASAQPAIDSTDSLPAMLRIAKTSEPAPAAVAPERKPYKVGFARQLLAAEILEHCHQHPTTGRVKLQKLIHLCEYHAELDDIHGSYARAAAGPFDNKLMRGLANGLERQKWFRQVRGEKRTSYEPMQARGQHSKYLRRWSKELPKVHEVIRLFASAKTSTCEIASTLYAAWNDLIIEGKQPTDKEIIREASDPKRWHESKANIAEMKWPTALKWMREKGLVPRGYGAHTTR